MSWICLMCDEICYDEVWPWGDATLCNSCYLELTDVRTEEPVMAYGVAVVQKTQSVRSLLSSGALGVFFAFSVYIDTSGSICSLA